MKHALYIVLLAAVSSCGSYSEILVSRDYEGDQIIVQRHSTSCCGLTGLRFIYKEGKTRETVIYYSWFDIPYAEKEVRTMKKGHVIESQKYQLVFDTAVYRAPLIREIGFGDTTKYDINDALLSTQRVKPVITLDRIDSILLFHAPPLLTNIDKTECRIWLLGKASGYIKATRHFSYNHNGSKAIK